MITYEGEIQKVYLSKKNKEQTEKKKIRVVDSSGYEIEIDLLKERKNFSFNHNYFYEFRNVTISKYNTNNLI